MERFTGFIIDNGGGVRFRHEGRDHALEGWTREDTDQFRKRADYLFLNEGEEIYAAADHPEDEHIPYPEALVKE